MKPYVLYGDNGVALMVVEADDQVSAILYGFRHVRGFSGRAVEWEDQEQGLKEAFIDLGMEEAGAEIAARGRGGKYGGLDYRLIPRQEASEHFLLSSRSSARHAEKKQAKTSAWLKLEEVTPYTGKGR